MNQQFLAEKAKKKKKALTGVYVIVIIAIMVIVLVIRFALAGGKTIYFNGLPGSDDAYAVSQDFIKPTLKNQSVSFPETGYQFGKRSDSVYIIKSYYQTSDNIKTTYEVVMKYNGGPFQKKESWAVLSLDQ